jgi:CheY-like chemotaxis protein
MQPTVLIVDDEKHTRDGLRSLLGDNYDTYVAAEVGSALDVLQRAAAANQNLIITHEPTFFDHLDRTEGLESEKDPVYAAKRDFIKAHGLVVWRFHDCWRCRPSSGASKNCISE